MAVHGFVRNGQKLPPPKPCGQFRYGNRDDVCVMLRFDESDPHRQRTPTLAQFDEYLEKLGVGIFDAMSRLSNRERESMGNGPSGEALCYTSRGDLMVACYPGENTAHGVHIDNADGDGREGSDFGRVLTLIIYLNEAWELERDGGALRLHLPASVARTQCREYNAGASAAVDVCPSAGTIAIFRADRIMHEVRPCSQRYRLAASVWMCAGPA